MFCSFVVNIQVKEIHFLLFLGFYGVIIAPITFIPWELLMSIFTHQAGSRSLSFSCTILESLSYYIHNTWGLWEILGCISRMV